MISEVVLWLVVVQGTELKWKTQRSSNVVEPMGDGGTNEYCPSFVWKRRRTLSVQSLACTSKKLAAQSKSSEFAYLEVDMTSRYGIPRALN